MEYKRPVLPSKGLQPRIIIHGGAGNITHANFPPARYKQYREALLTIVCSALILRLL